MSRLRVFCFTMAAIVAGVLSFGRVSWALFQEIQPLSCRFNFSATFTDQGLTGTNGVDMFCPYSELTDTGVDIASINFINFEFTHGPLTHGETSLVQACTQAWDGSALHCGNPEIIPIQQTAGGLENTALFVPPDLVGWAGHPDDYAFLAVRLPNTSTLVQITAEQR
jgi:hypothetical protein